jgi:hypothetical protein
MYGLFHKIQPSKPLVVTARREEKGGGKWKLERILHAFVLVVVTADQSQRTNQKEEP